MDRGSERVEVDGEEMARGSDYIIDYTNGILLFLREDTIVLPIRNATVEEFSRYLLSKLVA